MNLTLQYPRAGRHEWMNSVTWKVCVAQYLKRPSCLSILVTSCRLSALKQLNFQHRLAPRLRLYAPDRRYSVTVNLDETTIYKKRKITRPTMDWNAQEVDGVRIAVEGCVSLIDIFTFFT